MKRTVLAGGLVILAVGTLAMAQMLPPNGAASPDAAEFDFVRPPSVDDGMAPVDTAEQVRAELAELRICLQAAEQGAADGEGGSEDRDRKVLLQMQGCLRASERLSADLKYHELEDMQAGLREAERQASAQGLPAATELVPVMTEAERQAEDDYLSLKLDHGPDVDVSGIERVPSAADNQPYRTCEKTPEMKQNLRSPGSRGNRAYRDISGYLSTTNVIATKDCTCAGKIIPHEAVAMFEDRLRGKFGVTVLEPKHTSDLYDEYQRQKKIVDAMCGDY